MPTAQDSSIKIVKSNTKPEDAQYAIPYLKERESPLDNVMVSWNALDSIAKYAGQHNRDLQLAEGHSSLGTKTRKITPQEALGLAAQETKVGAVPHLNIQKASPEIYNNTNVARAMGGLPAGSYINNYHWWNTSRTINPLLDGFRYYAEGDYNRGDKNHTKNVQATGERLFKKPQVQTWWDLSGRYQYNGNAEDRPNFVKRIEDPKRTVIKDHEQDGAVATHKLTYTTEGDKDVVFPMVQREGEKGHLWWKQDNLVDYTDPKNNPTQDWKVAYDNAVSKGDTLQVPKGHGEIVTTHYKEIYPTFDYDENGNNGYSSEKHWYKPSTWFEKKGGNIHINPAHEGDFTAEAKKRGMSVQAFATKVLANKERYSPKLVKQANFARNAKSWKHQEGGTISYFKFY